MAKSDKQTKKQGIWEKMRQAALRLRDFISGMNSHIARSHAENAQDYMKGSAIIIEPNDKFKFGAVSARHSVQGPPPDARPETGMFEKTPRSQKESKMAERPSSAKFQRVQSAPKIWLEAARVIRLRYELDAIVQFSKKIGFDLKGFCEKTFHGQKEASIAEICGKVRDYWRENPKYAEENTEKAFHKFKNFGHFKQSQGSVNDYHTLVVFDANSWVYSPYQSMTTPFLSADEAKAVSGASQGNDSEQKFRDTANFDALDAVREKASSTCYFVPNPVRHSQENYFDNIDKMERQIVEAAGNIYPHVDFSQMNVPDDVFFRERDIFREHENSAAEPSKFKNIDEIPWVDAATHFMQEMNVKIEDYLKNSAKNFEVYAWDQPDEIRMGISGNGTISGYENTITCHIDKSSKAALLGGIYEKGAWLAERHEIEYKKLVHEYFHFPLDHDINRMMAGYEKNVAKMPKNENGDTIFPKNYPVKDYERTKAAFESLEDPQKFRKHVRNNIVERTGAEYSQWVEKMNNMDEPKVRQTTSFSLDSGDGNEGFRIATKVYYSPGSFVSKDELYPDGMFAGYASKTMPVPETLNDFKEAYLSHLHDVYPQIDTHKLAEFNIQDIRAVSDYAKSQMKA